MRSTQNLLINSRNYQKRIKIFEAEAALADASKIIPGHPAVKGIHAHNFVNLRLFKEAVEIFEELHKESPDEFSHLFNIAEMHFVLHDWSTALIRFNQLEAKFPDHTLLADLIKFKKYIIYTKLDQSDKAEEISSKYTLLSDAPIAYYTKIIQLIEQADFEKARSWAQRTQQVYTKSKIVAYTDSLEESGYLKLLNTSKVEQ